MGSCDCGSRGGDRLDVLGKGGVAGKEEEVSGRGSFWKKKFLEEEDVWERCEEGGLRGSWLGSLVSQQGRACSQKRLQLSVEGVPGLLTHSARAPYNMAVSDWQEEGWGDPTLSAKGAEG